MSGTSSRYPKHCDAPEGIKPESYKRIAADRAQKAAKQAKLALPIPFTAFIDFIESHVRGWKLCQRLYALNQHDTYYRVRQDPIRLERFKTLIRFFDYMEPPSGFAGPVQRLRLYGHLKVVVSCLYAIWRVNSWEKSLLQGYADMVSSYLTAMPPGQTPGITAQSLRKMTK